jgi:hypothetical protein
MHLWSGIVSGVLRAKELSLHVLSSTPIGFSLSFSIVDLSLSRTDTWYGLVA